MNNIYYSPEKFGLRTVGEVDFSSGSYEFDVLVVFQSTETGRLYYAEDSGCSCPSPFESVGVEELTPFVTVDDLRSRLKSKADNAWREYVSADDIDRLVAAVRELLR